MVTHRGMWAWPGDTDRHTMAGGQAPHGVAHSREEAEVMRGAALHGGIPAGAMTYNGAAAALPCLRVRTCGRGVGPLAP